MMKKVLRNLRSMDLISPRQMTRAIARDMRLRNMSLLQWLNYFRETISEYGFYDAVTENFGYEYQLEIEEPLFYLSFKHWHKCEKHSFRKTIHNFFRSKGISAEMEDYYKREIELLKLKVNSYEIEMSSVKDETRRKKEKINDMAVYYMVMHMYMELPFTLRSQWYIKHIYTRGRGDFSVTFEKDCNITFNYSSDIRTDMVTVSLELERLLKLKNA